MPEVTVTLNKPHTHAGQTYEAGASLTLGRHDAEFLLAHKIIGVIPAGASTVEVIESEEEEASHG